MTGMPRGVLAALLACSALALAACQREEDPAKAGFVSGSANLLSGTYDQRMQQKQQELSQAEQLRQQLAARAAQSQQEEQQTAAELHDWEDKVAAMDAELAKLRKQLAAARRARGAADRQVAEAERQVKAAQKQREQLAGEALPSADEQQRYERQMQAARDAVRLVSQSE